MKPGPEYLVVEYNSRGYAVQEKRGLAYAQAMALYQKWIREQTPGAIGQGSIRVKRVGKDRGGEYETAIDPVWRSPRHLPAEIETNPHVRPKEGTYAEVKKILGSNRASRVVGNNTKLEALSSREVGLLLHRTYILRYRSDGEIILNSGGYQTVTTKARMNEWMPPPWKIVQKDRAWYLWNAATKEQFPFSDGMKISTGKPEDYQGRLALE